MAYNVNHCKLRQTIYNIEFKKKNDYIKCITFAGTEMDYVENKLSSEFVFNNPNIKGTCGCGESFSI